MATISEISRGLMILARYTDEGMDAPLGGVDHDIIYGPEIDSETEIEECDRIELETLGWTIGHGTGQWYRSVYRYA